MDNAVNVGGCIFLNGDITDNSTVDISMEDVFAESGKMLQRLKDNFKWGAKTGGLNVTFEGNEKGLVYGGFKKRHIGCH